MRTITPLRVARKSRDLRIAELAAASGVSVRQISRLEAGRCRPNRTTAAALAAALGCSVADLFPLEEAS